MRNPEGLSFRKALDGASPWEKFSRPLSPRSVLGERAEPEAVGIGADAGGRRNENKQRESPPIRRPTGVMGMDAPSFAERSRRTQAFDCGSVDEAAEA